MTKSGIRLESGGATENTVGLNPMVGIAREDGTAGLGATYQFMLTTIYP